MPFEGPRPKAWSVHLHPHIGFGHDLQERPLRTGTGIQQRFREVRTLPRLGNPQLDRTHPGVPAAGPIPVTTIHPIRAPLTQRSSTDHIRLRGHQPLREATDHLPQQIIALCLEFCDLCVEGLVIPGGYRAELSVGSICLTIGVPPPAGNSPIGTNPTRMSKPC